ncbi:hypothetical protein SCLCIDRAFT_394773 [Scleroderma citrinum Foug A]|uniref:Uncharacterized protein n=1 Tax=Scleroderma citrinum Foug A TaxID=1036808 RepID=A0A0C3EDL0_9AGAM|nr:hypothetical protein SCLCIDRAFT_394773 [Scleroderma citrinum Foug A]
MTSPSLFLFAKPQMTSFSFLRPYPSCLVMERFQLAYGSTLLFLLLSARGFDFPFIVSINSALSVSGILRDLNHHIPALRNLHHSSRLDLHDSSLSILSSCPLQHYSRSSCVPLGWRVTQETLRRA